MSEDCIFCRIAAGDAPAVRLAEDPRTIAFLDLFPAATGHTLIIPRAHSENLLSAATVDLEACLAMARRVAAALMETLEPDGFRLSQFNGAAAGQTVFHTHLHVVPAYAGQPRRSHGRERLEPAELEALAARIRPALQA